MTSRAIENTESALKAGGLLIQFIHKGCRYGVLVGKFTEKEEGVKQARSKLRKEKVKPIISKL